MIIQKIKNTLHRLLNPVNPKIWYEYPNPKAVYGGKASLKQYEESLTLRRDLYEYEPSDQAKKYSLEIEENGFVIIPNFLSLEKLEQLKQIVEIKLNKGQDLLNTDKPQSELRPNEAFAAINQPFVTVPEIIEVALDPLIVDITSAYLNCYSALGTCNLRKSFLNDLPDMTTQIFHVDPNSPRFLKCFIYLDDVTMEGGPFCYVKGSHRSKFQGWDSKYRWTNEEILSFYGSESARFMVAKKGDLIIADTNGFHRGVKPTASERTMLTLDYTCHIEGFEEKNKFLFPKSYFDQLEISKRPLLDFVSLVD